MSVFQPGHAAVITGGASGIGLALASRCLAHGMRVLVADRDAATLAAAARNAAPPKDKVVAEGGTLTTLQMDVSQPGDWARLKEQVAADLAGDVHLLALNAGVGGSSAWTDVAAFHRILDVNLWGVVHGIAALLPLVKATAAKATTSPASVVITGSKQGITNPPGTSPAYNASKAAVRALAEQLAYDLDKEADTRDRVHVHLLVPGWTFTGLSGNDPLAGQRAAAGAEDKPKKQKPDGAWWPEQVVDYLARAIEKDPKRFYVLCPDNDVTEAVDRKRILWSAGDVAEGRPPLSRWRPEFKDQVDAWMKKE